MLLNKEQYSGYSYEFLSYRRKKKYCNVKNEWIDFYGRTMKTFFLGNEIKWNETKRIEEKTHIKH